MFIPPDEASVEWSFDGGGNLTLSRSGDVLGVVTCDEMRAYAEEQDFLTGGLIEFQLLGFSPEGAAWLETHVAKVSDPMHLYCNSR